VPTAAAPRLGARDLDLIKHSARHNKHLADDSRVSKHKTTRALPSEGNAWSFGYKPTAQTSRRDVLRHISALVAAVQVAQMSVPPSAAAAVAAQVDAGQQKQSAPGRSNVNQLEGKGGVRLDYPADWLVAFNRPVTGNSGRRAIALVGDFKSYETASVQQLDLDMLGQSGAAILRQHFGQNFVRKVWQPAPDVSDSFQPKPSGATFDGKAVIASLLDEVRHLGSTFDFELVRDSGTTYSARGLPSVDFEYVLAVCRGQTEEGLEGTRRCLGANGDQIQPISRHLLALATFKRGKGYLLTASAPVDRWPEAEPRLRRVMSSFQLV